MLEPTKNCQMYDCNRVASALCLCCNKNVCTRHFTEHIETLKRQINPLANEVSTMVEKVQSLTVEQIITVPTSELQKWKTDMHQLIDEIFLTKTKEMEDLIEMNKDKFVKHKKQQLETIMKMQDDVKQLVEDDDATFQQIQMLKNQLAGVEKNLTSFQKHFLSVNTVVYSEALVTVSSNLNTPLFSFAIDSNPATTSTVSSRPKLKAKQTDSKFGATPSGFSFPGFGTGLQNSPSTHSSSLPSSASGAAVSIVPSTFGGNPLFTGFECFSNQTSGGNNTTFSFNNTGQK